MTTADTRHPSRTDLDTTHHRDLGSTPLVRESSAANMGCAARVGATPGRLWCSAPASQKLGSPPPSPHRPYWRP